jgi:predicted exporter
VLALLLSACLAGFVKNNSLNLDSNILGLLPATEADPAVEQAFTSFSEQSMRRLVFLVANPDKSRAKQDAAELAMILENDGFVAEVELRRGVSDQGAVGDYYFQHRHHLLSKSNEELLVAGDFSAFSEAAIQQAYAPFSGGLINLLQDDPFLLAFRSANAEATATRQNLELDDGYLLARDGADYYVLLTAELAQSPFNQDAQEQLLPLINTLEAEWDADVNGSRMIRTGALFYAADAFATARHEVSVIGGSSMVLVLLLIYMTFRSVRPLLLVTVALWFGVAAGFVIVRLLFGEVHLLTLVFGASLIGVAEDYAFHYFAIDEKTGAARLKHVLPAISLGLLTCVIGYAALLVTPFPGLQQMAVFSICGLIGAYLTVVLLFPAIPLHNKNSPWLLGLCQRLITISGSRFARSGLYIALLLPVFAIALLNLTERQPEDVRSFQPLNAGLQAQEQIIQRLLNAPAANQFYIVKASTAEELLQNLEAAEQQLDALVAMDAMDGYLNIASSLPSFDKQMRNYQLYAQLYASDAGQSLIETGLLTEERLTDANAIFASDQQNYLQPQDWLNSPLGKELAYLWLEPEGVENNGAPNVPGYASVIALRNVKRLDLMTDFETGAGGQAVFVDKVSTVNTMLADYRHNTGLMLFVTCGMIFLILLLRYKMRKAILILTVPVVAISTTVLVLAVLGEDLSLFHILPFFLLIGLGVDFGIFFAEDGSLSSTTFLTVLLSALTTLFSFGMLTLSTTSAIHAFGLSMLIGLTCDLILSPVAGNMIVRQKIITEANTTG